MAIIVKVFQSPENLFENCSYGDFVQNTVVAFLGFHFMSYDVEKGASIEETKYQP